jgi:all-trans-retinol 13,14-reductase
MKYGCVVIGGGISGMTTAIIMAKEGYRTALLETSRHTGPTVRGFTRWGLFFDTGFHYTGGLGEGEPLDIFFRYLGLSGKVQKYPFHERGFDTFRCLDPSFEFPFPYGYERIRESLRSAFPKDAGAVNTYLDEVRQIYHSQPYVDIKGSGETHGLSINQGRTLRERLDSITGNEMLKSILSMHCMLHGVNPKEVPFAYHACIAGSYYESAHGIRGGGRSLTEAFDARLSELGVEVLCGTTAREILLSRDYSVLGLRTTDDRVLECERCVSTIHPRQLLRLVPSPAFRPVYRKRLEALEDTCSAIILYVESDLPPASLEGTNLMVFPTTRFPDLEDDGPVERKPLFITKAGDDKGKTAREGFIVICPEPHTETPHWSASLSGDGLRGYRSYKETMTTRAVAHFEASCPEFRGRITRVESATPLTLKRFTNSPAGSLYGVKHKVDQHNPLPLTKIKNLLLSGQAISGPGILGAMISGFAAGGSIMGHDKLREALRKWT